MLVVCDSIIIKNMDLYMSVYWTEHESEMLIDCTIQYFTVFDGTLELIQGVINNQIELPVIYTYCNVI